MIGMMYLVLTALLALQVNSAILMKFRLIDDALVHANEKSVTSAEGQITEMEKKALETKSAQDMKRLELGKQVQAKTQELVTYIRSLREGIIKRSGGMAKDGINYANINAEDIVAMEMIGAGTAKNPGKAKDLKAKLDEYVNYVKTWVPNAQPLALDAKEDPVARIDEHQKNKKFAELNFENTPMVAALAVLSQRENAVLRYESEALANISGQIAKEVIKFTNIQAAVSAESKVVAAGTKYVAEMYLTASSDQIKPTMMMDGRAVQVDPKTGHGKVEFTATPGAYDADGNAKKTWQGKIAFKQNGRDTSFTIKQEYVVARPVVQVQSASVQALYLNCGNKLNVQVPALGSTYDPSFTASGAEVIKGAKKGEVTLIPNAKEVALNVASNGNKLSTETFKVRLIPKPEIVATSGGRPMDLKRGMPSPGPREITLMAKPDESFKNFLPDDARYKITQFEIALVRGKRPVGGIQTVNSNSINLNSYAAQAQAGDRYMVEVKEVKRMNFRGQVETVSGTQNTLFNIPLN